MSRILSAANPDPGKNLDCKTPFDGVSLVGTHHNDSAIDRNEGGFTPFAYLRRRTMSKSRDTKRDTKKKPAQTPKEKKKNKQEKKRPHSTYEPG
jgi:hypothetical protein